MYSHTHTHLSIFTGGLRSPRPGVVLEAAAGAPRPTHAVPHLPAALAPAQFLPRKGLARGEF